MKTAKTKELSYDFLVSQVKESMAKIEDERTSGQYSLSDCLMSGFAMFSLKDPSLLSFIKNVPYRAENLRTIYGINATPSDAGMRKILDSVSPEALYPCFAKLVNICRENGELSKLKTADFVVVSIDGTGHFASTNIKCEHCLQKKLRNGKVENHHQMLVACAVKANEKIVLPLHGEAIIKQDGSKKNDCERNACKRLLPRIRAVLPQEKILTLHDALYADGKTIAALKAQDMSYIIVIKEGYALEQAKQLIATQQIQEISLEKDGFIYKIRWANQLILNGQNLDTFVSYFDLTQINQKTGEQVYFNSWITDLLLDQTNVFDMTIIARARWKIENETFNTLKNQGYQLEHNFGHGQYFLATVFAILMLLAFLVDQIVAISDSFFQKALEKAHTLRDLREKIRVLFDFIAADSMNFIFKVIALRPTFKIQLE